MRIPHGLPMPGTSEVVDVTGMDLEEAMGPLSTLKRPLGRQCPVSRAAVLQCGLILGFMVCIDAQFGWIPLAMVAHPDGYGSMVDANRVKQIKKANDACSIACESIRNLTGKRGKSQISQKRPV